LVHGSTPRYFAQGVPEHIILRGNKRQPIFAKDEYCPFLKETLVDSVNRYCLVRIRASSHFGPHDRIRRFFRKRRGAK
jgi:REP element-mobilizing transposase RayT